MRDSGVKLPDVPIQGCVVDAHADPRLLAIRPRLRDENQVGPARVFRHREQALLERFVQELVRCLALPLAVSAGRPCPGPCCRVDEVHPELEPVVGDRVGPDVRQFLDENVGELAEQPVEPRGLVRWSPVRYVHPDLEVGVVEVRRSGRHVLVREGGPPAERREPEVGPHGARCPGQLLEVAGGDDLRPADPLPFL